MRKIKEEKDSVCMRHRAPEVTQKKRHGMRNHQCLCVSACVYMAVQVSESSVCTLITMQIYYNVCPDRERDYQSLETSM